MKAPVAVVLVCLVAAASGCVGFGEPPAQAPPPAPVIRWVSLPLPDPGPDPPVFQFWVPSGALDLRIVVTDVEIPIDEEWTPAKAGHAPAADLFSDGEPRVLVLGPDAGPLAFTTYGPPVSSRTMPPGFNGTILTHTHETRHPAPGAYLVVLYGRPSVPAIEVRLPANIALPPALPAPFAFQRAFLHDGGLATDGLTAQGSIPLPDRTLIAYGDIIGTGLGARLELATDAGTVARTEVSALVSPPGWRGLTLGLDWPSGFTRYDELDPQPLVGPRLHFDLSGTGTAQAFALLGTASVTPPPYAVADAPAPRPAAERVELFGDLPPGQARWFLAPEDAALELLDEASEGPVHFRVYDLDGRRVHWGATADGRALFQVPDGPLIVVNDGPETVHLVLVGAAPTDATLHDVETKIVTESQDLDALQGHDAHTRPVHLDAPVLGWTIDTLGSLTDLQSSLLDPHRAALASAPDLNRMHPGQPPCCSLPLFTYAEGEVHWLDGGYYLLRSDATSGQGSVHHRFVVLDLERAAEAVAVAQAEPQL